MFEECMPSRYTPSFICKGNVAIYHGNSSIICCQIVALDEEMNDDGSLSKS